jgi:hypothetical protein
MLYKMMEKQNPVYAWNKLLIVQSAASDFTLILVLQIY